MPPTPSRSHFCVGIQERSRHEFARPLPRRLRRLRAVARPRGGGGAITLGVIGDSLSDEYQATASNRFLGYEGFSWVEILAQLRPSEVGFGAYDPTLGALNLPGGYDHDYALKSTKAFGGNVLADAADAGLLLPAFGQMDNLGQNRLQQVASAAADVGAGSVDAVVIWLGANDFNQRKDAGFSFDLANTNFQAFQANIVNALVAGLDTLIGAGATDILLAQIQVVDFSRADIVAATADTNAQLMAAAATRAQVTFFDPYAEVSARFDASSSSFLLAGFAVALGAAPGSTLVAPPGGVVPSQCGFNNATLAAACPTAAYQAFSVNDDATRLTTPLQGLVANSVIGALNSRGFSLTPLSDGEILSIAGVPEPGTAALVGLGLLVLALRRR